MAEKKPLKREWFCGQIGVSEEGRTITVYGWVESKRELGGITFLDLRDRLGVLQIVVNEHFSRPDLIRRIGREFVLAVQGEVVRRSNPNPELSTGQVELRAQEIEILAEAEMPPFFPDSQAKVAEELRFKYRFVDLRNLRLQKNFRLRSDICRRVRNYLGDQGFVEIETPILSKATPEGARDYLVPSRIYRGKMFALPQSPQLFKQLLMISGFERYFQIARCFRDEDLRADRQPEFTQIDMEMSFTEAEELFAIVERLLAEIFSLQGIRVQLPFHRLSYREAMEGYGSDKPDLRIPYRIQDFSESAARLGSSLLHGVLAGGGRICGIVIPEGAAYSRKMLDEANEAVRHQGGKGAIWLRQSEGLFRSSLKVADDRIAAFYKENGLAQQVLVFLVADLPPRVFLLTGKLREHLGRSFLNSDRREFLWVTDFPLFFFNEEEKRLDSNHHPFTAPRPEDIALLDGDPLLVKALAYDLVLNGIEIGGGSQRIHDANLQRKIMRLLNLPDEEIEEKFGYFLNALKYGAPPHLGIALGLDRIVMLCCGESSIRDVIAFPKTTSSLCLLTGSPSAVSAQQLAELGLALKE